MNDGSIFTTAVSSENRKIALFTLENRKNNQRTILKPFCKALLQALHDFS